jgi:hypothetical protein
MDVGPAQVHAQEHLGPVGRFGAAGAGADREDRRSLVVLAREQERRALDQEVTLQGRCIALELGGELDIRHLVEELDGRLEVGGTRQERVPGVDLGAQAVGLAQDLLGGSLVVPEPGFLGQRLESGDVFALDLEVKDAPRSTGSVQPGRG